MRFAFIEAEKAVWPVTVMCDVLEVSRSGYYAWAQHKVSARALEDARLAVMIRASHRRSRGTYGSPRIYADLRAQGVHVSKKRVERIMQAESLEARRKRRLCTTTDSKHDHPIAPERLGRDFHRDAPNETWVTDVTYVSTLEGWLYLAVMLDLFSRRVVGWAVSDRNDRSLAQEALRRALEQRRPPRGLVHHSDRGSVYASGDYRAMLTKHGVVASMSRRGDCWDNAVAESFFGTLKGEHVDHETYATRAAGAASIGEYIDFYNTQRRHSTLGYLSPLEYEVRWRCGAALT